MKSVKNLLRPDTGQAVSTPEKNDEAQAFHRPHIWYFDWLRLFAMLAVIYTHAASGYLYSQPTMGWYATVVLMAVSFSAVPLFFMMSGALLLSDERTADPSLLFRRRLPRVLVPLLFFSIVAVLWQMVRDGLTAQAALQSLLMGLNKPVYVHLWYSYTLAGLYLVSPFLYRMVHALDAKLERFLMLLIGAVVLLDLLWSLAPKDWQPFLQWKIAEELKLFGGHLFAFLLGYYLHQTKRLIRPGVLIAAAITITAVITAAERAVYLRTGAYVVGFFSQNGGWELLLAACLFLLAKRLLNRPSGVKNLSALSLAMPVYLSHNLILSYLNWKFLKPGRFLEVAAIWALTALLSWLLSKTLTTIPGLCYFSSGIPYRQACERANWIAAFRRLFRKDHT